MKLDDAAAHLEALGNPTRLKIYRTLIRAGAAGLPVGRLQDKLKIAPSTLSHHIKALVVVGDNIPWYFGTAGYPPGTQVHAIPAVSGRVYVVSDQGMRLPPVPGGFQHRSRSCHDGICVDGFSR